jgi:predicted transcriptional regulator
VTHDFLDEIARERLAANPDFDRLVEAALARRELLRGLARRREELGLSQTVVAARMETSQSSIARLESGTADTRLSTLERFATALGLRLDWRLEELPR